MISRRTLNQKPMTQNLTFHLRILLVALLAAVAWATAAPQTSTPSGSIAGSAKLRGDGPAMGATVMLSGTRIGTTVGEDGSFVLADVPQGTYLVEVRLVGYEPEEIPSVTVEGGKISSIAVTMRPVDIEMSPVVVTGTRRQEADDVRPSVTRMSPRESKILPGAAEDVLRSLQAVPGVTSVSDFSSELVVRGSGPDQNLMLIDGYEVLNPYRLYGFVSMFNPETVSDISLQTGGFGAQYGDRLSAVLDVRNREGRYDVLASGKLNLSLTNLNLIVEGGLPLAGSSYLVSLRRTYYDLIMGPILKSAKLVDGDVALPNFRDMQVRITLPTAENSRFVITGITSRDGVDLVSGAERPTPDSVNVFDKSYNTLVGATWNYNPSKNLILQTLVSWYRNNGSGSFEGMLVDPSQNTGDLEREDTSGLRFFSLAVDYEYVFQKVSVGQRVLWNLSSHAIESGFGVDLLRTDFTQLLEVDQLFASYLQSRGQVIPSSTTQVLRYHRYNVYVQDRITFGDRLFVQPGVRLDVYPVLGRQVYVAPRLNISYRLDELSTLRAAYGAFYQSPGMEKLNFRSRIQYTLESFASLEAERADHYILGYDRMVSPEWQFKTEVYYKDLHNLIVPQKLQGTRWYAEPNGGPPLSPLSWGTPSRITVDSLTSFPVNGAQGSAYGVEVMLQKMRSLPGDRFTGWVSYALSAATRERDGVRTPFLFDQRHAVNVVGNYKFAESWDLGLRFTLRSGRPFALATGVQPRVFVQQQNGVERAVLQLDAKGNAILDPVYELDSYSGRFTTYHSFDVRLTTYPSWFGLDWAVYLDVQNVYNRSNQQQISFYVGPNGELQQRVINGIPIFPSLGMSLVF